MDSSNEEQSFKDELKEYIDGELTDLANNETLIDNIADVVKAEVPLVKTAEQPTFVNSVDEMIDTSKVYVLSTDGCFYYYKETDVKNYNLFKISEVTYLSRLQDDVEGIILSNTSNVVSGWIPVTYGKYYTFAALVDGNRVVRNATNTYPYHISRVNGRKADGTVVVWGRNFPLCEERGVLTIPSEDIVEVQIHISTNNICGGIDISTAENLAAWEPMFVEGTTTDESYYNARQLEYIDGNAQVEGGTGWYSTGMAYNQPAEYEERVIELEKKADSLETEVSEIKDNMENPASASPYYRDVNFGVLPFTYYQGVAASYESAGFQQNTKYADFIATWKALVAPHNGYVTETNLGNASDGQPIYLYDFKPARISNQNKPIPKIIIVAGQHGFEKSNIFGLYYFVDNLLNKWNHHSSLEYVRNNVELMIVPVLNTYGFDTLEYKNANGVNLNRNYNSHWKLLDDTSSDQYGGAEPFDQPETQFVRDVVANNSGTSLVIDFHTNGQSSVVNYYDINWCGVCSSTDSYYNRMKDSIAHHLSAITAHFNLDYELNQPNVMMGHMTDTDGNGLLRNWAYDNDIVGVLVEGFNGFPNRGRYQPEVFKANEEIIVNYLNTALYYLAK